MKQGGEKRSVDERWINSNVWMMHKNSKRMHKVVHKPLGRRGNHPHNDIVEGRTLLGRLLIPCHVVFRQIEKHSAVAETPVSIKVKRWNRLHH